MHRPGVVSSPAGLLAARQAVVDFHGREALLHDLREWADSAGVGVCLVHGPGGQGKTRLALELARHREGAGVGVWLREDASPEELGVLAATVTPVLVIIDYAEARTAQVAAVLAVLARRQVTAPAGSVPWARVVLLARTAGAWWSEQLADTSDAVAEFMATAWVVALPVLDDTETARQQGYQAAVAGLSRALARLSTTDARGVFPSGAGAWQEAAQALAGRRLPAPPVGSVGWTVLAVQMTALADLLDLQPGLAGPAAPGVAASPGAADSPEGRVLRHERRYWRATATAASVYPGLSMVTLTDTVAATVVTTPPSAAEVQGWLRRIPGLADQPVDVRERVRTWLAGLYPSGDPAKVFGSIEPDRLAEHLIGQVLTDSGRVSIVETVASLVSGQDAVRWVTVCARAAAHPGIGGRVGTVVAQVCREFPDRLAVAAIEVAPRLELPGPLVAAVQGVTQDPLAGTDVLIALADAFPEQSDLWADVAVEVSLVVVTRCRQEALDTPAAQNRLATSLNTLALRLGGVGRREDSLVAITEAVEVCRQLAEAHPDAYLPNFAGGLNNQSLRLGELGQHEEGLVAVAEAVEVYRRLAAAHPDAHLANLAGSLINLSSRWGDLGRFEEALEAITEAVAIWRRLVEARPDAYLPVLAGILNNQSVRLGDVGRFEDGLEAIAEAVGVYRRLVEARPDAYLPNLAGILNNLSVALGGLGRREEEVEAITGAVEVYRWLAEAQPDVYLPNLAGSLTNLAGSLTNLSVALGGLGRFEEGLVAVNEAVEVYRGLVEARPDAYLPILAASLSNLSNLLCGLGRFEEDWP